VALTTGIHKVGVTNEATVSTASYEKDVANNSASATVSDAGEGVRADQGRNGRPG
jgi:hypothetical protein